MFVQTGAHTALCVAPPLITTMSLGTKMSRRHCKTQSHLVVGTITRGLLIPPHS